jgi:hypothetical protein
MSNELSPFCTPFMVLKKSITKEKRRGKQKADINFIAFC